ncbi:Hypothetical protein R9X50_00628200 [Acrodontium crateriforme]|uniref:C2H2-type domain-containing protein n=1 Tax=Acrodontium crateriforme TaxID=150365 RepID=A0AAQ3M7M8_9PEZI|nr:Hypothetical protein R9X50_00628200 [Acrodontium crateriforme]
MTVPKCGVCQTEDSKYKCPVCELRYCSINCFKAHKTIHAEDEFPSANSQASSRIVRDRPGTTQRIPKIDYTGFENNAEFKRLLIRYPLLKLQLQSVYGLTLEPGPDEARTWHRQPLYGEQRDHRQQFGGRGRGRGRGMQGDRGGKGRGDFHSSTDRQRGPWTQEKGDKEALSTIQKMRQGAEDDERAEGMREFAELCRMTFAPDAESPMT